MTPMTAPPPPGPPSFAWWAFDPATLAACKEERGLRVSLCLPARDEDTTVGDIVGAVRRRLVDQLGLVDDLVVIDDGSSDRTAEVAADAGARVVRSGDILPEAGPGQGKGNAIWKSLAACDGDIICWIDADIRNFELHFVTGLIGPLLSEPPIQFVKGHYRRPLNGEPTGGGRVTELLARPLLSRFFPELAGFAQPLAGEYAGTRALLESIPFVQGWGVEIGLLIDVVHAVGLANVAQVDLGVREHRNRPLSELAPQAMAILLTTLARAGIDPGSADAAELVRFDGEAGPVGELIEVNERPPIISVPAYRMARERDARPSSGTPSVAHRTEGTLAVTEPDLTFDPASRRAKGPALHSVPADDAPLDHPEAPGVDRPRLVAAVRELLIAVGEDPSRDGLQRTPERVADMYLELFSGLHEDPSRHLDVRFEADHDELVLVRDIPFASMCEHHLMPFIGTAHVGYIPGVDGRITGLSKLARLLDGVARRPQVQERLTSVVADVIEATLAPRGVLVVIEAEHLCMTMRGVRKPGSVTVTSAVRGLLRDDAAARGEAMSMLHGRSRSS
jgi:glucosyl-3-phosphoglycerate synthase